MSIRLNRIKIPYGKHDILLIKYMIRITLGIFQECYISVITI